MRAAIPSNTDGQISACYDKKDGSLRVIDAAAGNSCDTKRESPIAWPSQQGSAGSQTAYAYLNKDGSLDTTFSKNIVNVTATNIGTDPSSPSVDLYTYCFDLSFNDARWAIPTPTALRGMPGQASVVDSKCGTQYDAVYENVPITNDPNSTKYPVNNFAFFN